jgi:hydrogenase maturation protease
MPDEIDILVLGLGNLLCSDDGVGVQAVRRLQADPPPGVVLVEAGTAVLHAVHFVERARRVLVIDAMSGGGPPGTLYGIALADTARQDWQSSMHSLGLRHALAALAPDRVPPPIHVLGVEPQNLDYGMELSAPVAAALPRIQELVRAWIAGGTPAMAEPAGELTLQLI